jgi:hypothetical protein
VEGYVLILDYTLGDFFINLVALFAFESQTRKIKLFFPLPKPEREEKSVSENF